MRSARSAPGSVTARWSSVQTHRAWRSRSIGVGSGGRPGGSVGRSAAGGGRVSEQHPDALARVTASASDSAAALTFDHERSRRDTGLPLREELGHVGGEVIDAVLEQWDRGGPDRVAEPVAEPEPCQEERSGQTEPEREPVLGAHVTRPPRARAGPRGRP